MSLYDDYYDCSYITPQEMLDFLYDIQKGIRYGKILEELGMILDLAKIVNSYIPLRDYD